MSVSALALFQMADACKPSGTIPGIFDGLCKGGEVEITSVSQAALVVTNGIRILLALSAMLAVAFIMVAGVYYIISAGDPGRVKTAKEILVNVGTGLVLILGSYAIVTFVAKGF